MNTIYKNCLLPSILKNIDFLVKMEIFFAKSKAQVFYAILIKIPAAFSVETHKLILQFIWKCKALQIAETILKTKTNVVPNFKTYYNATAINTMWYWHKDRHVEKQNRTRV